MVPMLYNTVVWYYNTLYSGIIYNKHYTLMAGIYYGLVTLTLAVRMGRDPVFPCTHAQVILPVIDDQITDNSFHNTPPCFIQRECCPYSEEFLQKIRRNSNLEHQFPRNGPSYLRVLFGCYTTSGCIHRMRSNSTMNNSYTRDTYRHNSPWIGSSKYHSCGILRIRQLGCSKEFDVVGKHTAVLQI